MECLLKESKVKQMKTSENPNYAWLKSRHVENNFVDLEEFKPAVLKVT
jgi:hypothetical protein